MNNFLLLKNNMTYLILIIAKTDKKIHKRNFDKIIKTEVYLLI